MRLTLTAKTNPFEGWIRAARAIARPPAGHLRPVEEAMRHGFARNFSQQASGDGVPWPPLAPSTVAERIRLGYPGARPILVRAGDLHSSYTNPDDQDAFYDFRNRLDGFEIEAGSAKDTAIFHELGTANMPARPVAILSALAERQVLDAMDQLVDRLVQQNV